MNIAFRVDSSDLIGAGHVRRCLELAEKLRKKCDKVIFEIANKLKPKSYTSREFIKEIGKYLKTNAKKKVH